MKLLIAVLAVMIIGCDSSTSVSLEDATETSISQEPKPTSNEEFETLLAECEACEGNPLDGLSDEECFERFRCDEIM